MSNGVNVLYPIFPFRLLPFSVGCTEKGKRRKGNIREGKTGTFLELSLELILVHSEVERGSCVNAKAISYGFPLRYMFFL